MNEEELEEVVIAPKEEDKHKDEEEDKKKKKKEKLDKVPISQLFRYSTSYDYMLMFFGSVGSIIAGVATPAIIIVTGKLMDDLNTTIDELADKVAETALYLLYIGIAAWIGCYIQRACWMTTAERQSKRIREEFVKAILRQEIAWFDFVGTGALTSRLASDTVLISEGLGEKMASLVQHIGTFFAGFISAYIQGWQLSLVMTAMTPLIAAVGAFIVYVMSSLSTKGQKAYANAGSVATEIISAMRTVASFSGEARAISKYKHHLEEASRIGVKKGLFQGLGIGTSMFIFNASYALCLWYGGILVADHGYTGGEVNIILFSIIMGAFALGQTGPCMEAIGKAQGAAFKVFETIDRVPEIDASSEAGTKLKSIKGNIRLKKLHFAYPSRKEVKVLRGLNLKIKAGQTVALVGHSGCGKSSTVSLIQRFYDPAEGKITIDGTDIKELNLKWWRQQIGLVGQEPVLFTGTIAQNIAYGKEGATQEEIESAARAANAHNFIREFPQGYDTQVGEKGAQLSGGQKQRIAIARAIIKNPKILLLDEATSALDSESEKIVQQALDSVMEGRTTIVIAHRLSTIKNADVIVVVKDGVVAEKGKHEELMAQKGLYHELVHAQAAAQTNELDAINNNHKGKKFDLASSLDQQKSAENLDIIDETADVNEKEKDVPISRLFAMNKPEVPQLLVGSLGSALVGAINPMFAILFSYMMDIYYKSKQEIKDESAEWAVYFVYLAIAAFIGSLLQLYFFGYAAEKLVERARELTFTKILRNNIGFFDSPANTTGVLTSRLASDATLLESMLGARLGLIVQNVVTVATGVAIAFSYGWKLSLVILACSPLIAGANGVHILTINGFSGKNRKAISNANQIATEAISNIRTVAAFVTEDKVVLSYQRQLEIPYNIGVKVAHVAGFSVGLGQFVSFGVQGLAFWYGAQLIKDGDMDFLDFMVVLFAILLSAMALGQSSAMAPDATKGKQAAKAIFQLIDHKPEFDSSSPEGRKMNESFEGRVELKDIKFRYPTRPNTKVLRGLSLNIKPGQVVALVGPSGCGKSSLVSLMERFYDCEGGEVLLDGVNIKEYNIKSLRSHVGLVGQEPVLFSGTIAENIAYGKIGATQEEIEEAAKAANAHKFITQFPKGYSTEVGEKGAQLSGGQKQRIAIARAIIKNPKILLLDEATSALDTESEKIVQKALDQVMKGRTTIVVAHRLSTIKNADQIAVIHQGRVAELGTHDELMKEGGLYYSLAARQSA